MIKFETPMFRPPSEANSLLVQATIDVHIIIVHIAQCIGENQRFRVRPQDEIFQIIDELSSSKYKRAFVADGNALVMRTKNLCDIFKEIYKNSNMQRISLYGNVSDIM